MPLLLDCSLTRECAENTGLAIRTAGIMITLGCCYFTNNILSPTTQHLKVVACLFAALAASK